MRRGAAARSTATPTTARELRDALGARLRRGRRTSSSSGRARPTSSSCACAPSPRPTATRVVSDGSFVAYKLFLLGSGVPFTEVPLAKWRHRPRRHRRRGQPTRRSSIFLPNPNNPTGTRFGRAQLERFLAKLPEHVVLVLDDAYMDYDDSPTTGPTRSSCLPKRPRTVVLRSPSPRCTAWPACGVGYGIATLELIGAMLAGAAAVRGEPARARRRPRGARRRRALRAHRRAAPARAAPSSRRACGSSASPCCPATTNFVTVELASEAAATTLTERLLAPGLHHPAARVVRHARPRAHLGGHRGARTACSSP